jgi:hypothetical protein
MATYLWQKSDFVWNHMPPLGGVNKGPIKNKPARILVTNSGSYPPNSQGVTRKHQEKNRGHQRSNPCMLNLQTIKHALWAKLDWSYLKEEGSCPPASAKVMAKKKYIGHIPKTYPNIIAISCIPCWMEVEDMRHMTEGRHGDGSSCSERSWRSVNPLYTYTTRKLKYKAKPYW